MNKSCESHWVEKDVRDAINRDIHERPEKDVSAAAQRAWDKWHDSVGFADEDDYIPTMSPLWRIAFEAGVEWEAKGEK